MELKKGKLVYSLLFNDMGMWFDLVRIEEVYKGGNPGIKGWTFSSDYKESVTVEQTFVFQHKMDLVNFLKNALDGMITELYSDKWPDI
jgi:hypothetical protein